MELVDYTSAEGKIAWQLQVAALPNPDQNVMYLQVLRRGEQVPEHIQSRMIRTILGLPDEVMDACIKQLRNPHVQGIPLDALAPPVRRVAGLNMLLSGKPLSVSVETMLVTSLLQITREEYNAACQRLIQMGLVGRAEAPQA